MTQPSTITNLTIDRALLAHPGALHLRRMRIALWLYLYLKTLAGPDGTAEFDPADVGRAMGLPEGTIRSWIGHLRKGGYLSARHVGSLVRVRLPVEVSPEPTPTPAPTQRHFSVARVEGVLAETGAASLLEAALQLYPDATIQRALAGAMAVPDSQIRKSRTALFLYLLKHHANQHTSEDHPGH